MADKYDEVGYGNPPKHTQWKKGQSGNPTGKKSKSETLHQIMKRLLGQEVVVQKNGVQMSMSQGEAMLTSIFTKAMKGDIVCVKFLHSQLGIDLDPQTSAVPVTEADIACLQSQADWLGVVEEAHADFANQEQDEGYDDTTG